MFEVVISAYFRKEEVHQYVNKVHCHPLVVAETSYIYRFFFQILAHDVAHRSCDSFNLSRASSLADDEVLGNASIDFCQVGDNNVLTFLFLYTFFNSLYELFNCVYLSFLSYLIYILYFSAKIHYYNGKST